MRSHRIPKGRVVAPIWTHDECLRFITVKPGFITIWEVGFTSTCAPAVVESLPAPDNINHQNILFLPTHSRLAFTLQTTILVWDAEGSRLLLEFVCAGAYANMAFSPDGRFFACGTADGVLYLWKESSTGYVPHQIQVLSNEPLIPLFSPDGESIIVQGSLTIRLWRTTDPATPLPNIPTLPAKRTDFILEFSPDGILAAVARRRGNTATVLDLKSGDPRLIVDTGMEILGLMVTGGSDIVVVGEGEDTGEEGAGEGKVVTWNTPPGTVRNARANADHSVWTTAFGCSGPQVACASVSPGLTHIATAGGIHRTLNLYDLSTGKCLADVTSRGYAFTPWFTPDGHRVWVDGMGTPEGWSIIKDTESGLTRLESLKPTVHPQGGIPWESSRGCKVTEDDRWLINASGKRLLWLPSNWRVYNTQRVWRGSFLGLLSRELPEAVVLELLE